MDLLQITINCLSEIALFIGLVVFLFPANVPFSLKRIAAATGILIVINIIFQSNFFNQMAIIQITLLVINYVKFVFLTAFVIKKFRLKDMLMCLIIQFLCYLISAGIRLFVIEGCNPEETVIDDISLFFTSILLLVLLICAKNNSKRNSISDVLFFTPTYIYFLILLSLFIGNSLITVSDYLTNNYSLQIKFIEGLSFTIICIIITIIILLLFNVFAKKYYKDINSILKKQTDIQLRYYQQKEKSNKELRQFKHDYNNHINCIGAMLKAERIEEASSYLSNISNSFPSEHFMFNTGNFIADAILSDKQELCAAEGIVISFDGKIENSIDNTDLCIILSNALDNAIEAAQSCDANKCVSVYGGFHHGYSVIIIKNPVIFEPQASLLTTKLDKENHGFGLENIRRVVEKYNGTMNVDCKDSIFTLNIMLNCNSENKITN